MLSLFKKDRPQSRSKTISGGEVEGRGLWSRDESFPGHVRDRRRRANKVAKASRRGRRANLSLSPAARRRRIRQANAVFDRSAWVLRHRDGGAA